MYNVYAVYEDIGKEDETLLKPLFYNKEDAQEFIKQQYLNDFIYKLKNIELQKWSQLQSYSNYSYSEKKRLDRDKISKEMYIKYKLLYRLDNFDENNFKNKKKYVMIPLAIK